MEHGARGKIKDERARGRKKGKGIVRRTPMENNEYPISNIEFRTMMNTRMSDVVKSKGQAMNDERGTSSDH